MTDQPMTPPSTAGTPGRTVAVLMREAASALHSAMDPSTPWQDLPYPEQARWGLRAAPSVLATLLLTKPEGWESLFRELQGLMDLWRREGTDPRAGGSTEWGVRSTRADTGDTHSLLIPCGQNEASARNTLSVMAPNAELVTRTVTAWEVAS